jgi:hypothetical protein
MGSKWGLVLAVMLLPVACSGGNDGTDAQDVAAGEARLSDQAAEAVPCKKFKVVGQPCADDCECLGGWCVLNEYAPFRFCSKPCGEAVSGTKCAPEIEGGAWTSLCVQFPSKWRVPPDQFCAPLCESQSDCDALGAPWETCEVPAYKGNPLYSASVDKVCISPSAQGHDPVDPDTCEGWEALYNDKSQERNVCLSYCEYLKVCQKLPPELSQQCCAFHCTAGMVTNGNTDKEMFDVVRCYHDNYVAFSGTALVCTKPEEACPPGPEIE